MPNIPNDLSQAQQEARQADLEVKRRRFFYATEPPYHNLDVPWLHPGSVAKIEQEEPEYWIDRRYEEAFLQRKNEAYWTVATGLAGWVPGAFGLTLENYPDLKSLFVAPNELNFRPDFRNDWDFGTQRLIGANPFSVKRVTSLDELPLDLGISDSNIRPDVKLATAVDERRLYLCDYKALQPLMEVVPDGAMNKFLFPPAALFYWEGPFSDSGKLLPLGIQLRHESGSGDGVFMAPGSKDPIKPSNWLLAKAAVQSADAHMLEWDIHLGRTHVALIPFAISSERQLHADHPVLLLLRPHLRMLLVINNKHDLLIAPESFGDLVFQPQHNDFMGLISSNYTRWKFDVDNDYRQELISRNMWDAPIPYPYRDDGKLIYEAIYNFVSRYIKHYYSDNSKVESDRELGAFIKEVLDPRMGRLELHLQDADQLRIEDRQSLIWLLTTLIWTAGPLHAAVNYPQWGYMADPRNMPLCLYQEMPVGGNVPEPPFPAGFFPPQIRAHQQTGLGYVLGTYRYDMLGSYRPKDFLDPPAQDFVKQFQCDLMHAGHTIVRTDAERLRTYPYLFPWNIPNGTSI